MRTLHSFRRFLPFLLAAAPALSGCTADATEPAASSTAALSQYPATCGYDPTGAHVLADLMAKPIAGDADADSRFKCLQQILYVRKDRRAPFATLYSTTTTNVIAAIQAGHFQDGVWVGQYLEAFAELYRAAFYAYETGNRGAVPEAWRLAFDTAAGKKELIVQDLALGVNAHVNRDLAYALVQVGIGDTPAERAVRYLDHTAVNDVLHAELNGALATIAALYAPGFGQAPAQVMQIMESVFFAALVTGRQAAWDHAVQIVDSGWLVKLAVEGSIEVEAAGLAAGILAPELDPQLMKVLRALEGS